MEGLNFNLETLLDLGDPACLEKAEGLIFGILIMLEFIEINYSVFFLTIYTGTFSNDLMELKFRVCFLETSMTFLGFN